MELKPTYASGGVPAQTVGPTNDETSTSNAKPGESVMERYARLKRQIKEKGEEENAALSDMELSSNDEEEYAKYENSAPSNGLHPARNRKRRGAGGGGGSGAANGGSGSTSKKRKKGHHQQNEPAESERRRGPKRENCSRTGNGNASALASKAEPSMSAAASKPITEAQGGAEAAAAAAAEAAERRERRRRSVSLCSNESVDEFGRVKRKRKATDEEGGIGNDEDVGAVGGGRRGSGAAGCWNDDNVILQNGGWGGAWIGDDDYGKRGNWGSRSRSNDSRGSLASGEAGMGAGGEEDLENVFSKRAVHVGDLPPECMKEDLKEFFEKCGEVVDVKLFQNKPSRFGFVTFALSKSMFEAIDTLHGAILLGSRIRVSRARIPDWHHSRTSANGRKPSGATGWGLGASGFANSGVYSTPDSSAYHGFEGGGGAGKRGSTLASVSFESELMRYASLVGAVEVVGTVGGRSKTDEMKVKVVAKVKRDGDEELEEGEVSDEEAVDI
ncbi:hypothetical protein HK101_008709 [Irineochytrium annulatum]|nr:hypothetical protein HK101_008709 [Irineochytrium annulatum]